MKVVIVGSNHAGISTAATLTNYYKDLEITVFEQSDSIAYIGADGLLWVSGEIDNIEQTLYSSPGKLISKGINFQGSTNVYEIDQNKNQVLAKNSQEQVIVARYDKLVLACGSSPIRTIDLNILQKATHYPQILTAKTLSEGKKLFDISRKTDLSKVAVIGGGYIGVETVNAFRLARPDITIDLWQKSDQILNNYFDKKFADMAKQELNEHNINVILNETLTSSCPEILSYDLVVEAIGFHPNSQMGNLDRIEPSKAYKVNNYGQTSDPNIYAVGDCASVYNNVLEQYVNMPLGSYATHSAIVAAHHIGSQIENIESKHKYNGSQGASTVKVFDIILSSVGMTYEVAKNKLADDVDIIDFSNFIKPKYLTIEQGNAPITIRAVFNKKTLLLLGFQIACSQDVTPIIHLLSLALQKKMTAYQLRYLDMFFLPELNQVYNYLQRLLSQIIKSHNL
ncbi:MAG: FAD-dependent oxidoreductase [Bifidobacteriaceae bacterium]|jgi:NADPH-dependent 2,4-dienoyl-CoA reductase/sulfur reductase-like enzyme|nr:FAD-dependent oxidoreductase [Bifidobacteriaceae bacterium]